METETLLATESTDNTAVDVNEGAEPSSETVNIETVQPKKEFSLPEGWTTNEGLKNKFTTLEGLAKSYESLEKKLSKKGIIPINEETATQEDKDEFYKALGRPDTHEGYEFKEEIDNIDKESYQKYFHELGLPKKVGEKIFSRVSEMVAQAQEAQKQTVEEQKAKAIEELQQDERFAGANWNKSINVIKNTLKKYGSEDLIQDPSFANNPKALRLVLELASKTGEHKYVDAKNPETPLDIKARIEEITKANNELMKDKFANANQIQRNSEEKLRLMEKLYK